MNNKLTAVSLFSGCGGFDLGASKAGIDIIWANDIDRFAGLAYKSNMPDVEFSVGDVREIKNFPEADVLIGCYPCTGFSLAARRKWKTRSERNLKEIKGNFLYEEFIRSIDFVKPKYLFIENVGGMVSADDGWFFNEQLRGLEEKGYEMKFQMLKSEEFGLAQTRRRIFLVGVRKDLVKDGFSYSFPTPTHGKHGAPHATMANALDRFVFDSNEDVYYGAFHGHYLTRNRKRRWDQPSFTIVATASHVPLHPSGEPMVKVGKDHWALQGEINRRLSWRECAVLQGFKPESLNFDAPLENKYKVVGNAVPPNFGYSIVRSVVEHEMGASLPQVIPN